MIDENLIKLMSAFPRSFINQHGEFIAHEKANEYFNLGKCKNEEEVKCKILEWFSRGACKTAPYKSRRLNYNFNDFMLDGINTFLETKFTTEEMYIIYGKLGNECNRTLCIEFIKSGYNMKILEGKPND